MSVLNAKEFIRRSASNEELREKMLAMDSFKSRMRYLRRRGLSFSENEYDIAYHKLLADSSSETNANLVYALRMWWHAINSPGISPVAATHHNSHYASMEKCA